MGLEDQNVSQTNILSHEVYHQCLEAFGDLEERVLTMGVQVIVVTQTEILFYRNGKLLGQPQVLFCTDCFAS